MQICYEEPEEIAEKIQLGVVALLKAGGNSREASMVENSSLSLIIQSYSFDKYQVNLTPEDAVYIKENPSAQKIIEEHLVTVSNGNLKDQDGGLLTITSSNIGFGIKIQS